MIRKYISNQLCYDEGYNKIKNIKQINIVVITSEAEITNYKIQNFNINYHDEYHFNQYEHK